MKAKLLIPSLLLFGFPMFSNASTTITEVPKVVLDAFSRKFPTAQKIEWEKEKGVYEADFILNKKEVSAEFKADGTWLETENVIALKDIPKAVKKALRNEFPKFKVEKAEQINRSDNSIYFEIELENDKEKMKKEAVFSAEGILLEKEIEKEEDKN